MVLLSESQVQTLQAVVDRIIPKDDFPSGSEAGCVDFLLKLIADESLESFYISGLNEVESKSLKFGSLFKDLPIKRQDSILDALSHSSGTRKVVLTIARQTIEGYYSDPGNGANKESLAWEMIGFKVTA